MDWRRAGASAQPGRWRHSPDGPRQLAPTTVTATPAGLTAAMLWLYYRITGPSKQHLIRALPLP